MIIAGAAGGISNCRIQAILVLSIVAFAVGTANLFFKKRSCGKRRSFERRGILFLLLLLFSMFLMRYVVGRSGKMGNGLLTVREEIINSLIHTLQSFTLDEEYTNYLTVGKEFFSSALNVCWANLYAWFVSLLNVVCAISGGAILLTILVKLFPRMKLWLIRICFWKRVCFFSEINPESVALAGSIRNNKEDKRKNALLVFCNADPDNEEISSECFEQARQLGAILTEINLDELDLPESKRKGKTFFLTGTDENNLAILSGFTDDARIIKFSEKDSIYVFANDNYGTLLEKTVRDKINGQLNQKAAGSEAGSSGHAEKKITLFSVNRYRSLVYNLLERTPLFKALPENSRELRIALFGSGKIGTEMFLSVYWCGQMLGRELYITMVSDEEEEHFKKRVDHINSDIFRTSRQYQDGHSKDDLLKIDHNGTQGKYYFNFEYVHSDVYLDGLDILLTENRRNGRLADFDYYAVALGSDKKNMEVAEHIGRVVTVAGNRIHKADVPVACAIWDDDMCKALTNMEDAGFSGMDIIPFGSMRSSFDIEEVLLEKKKRRAQRLNALYEQKIEDQQADRRKFEADPYGYWANVSRAIHVQYKAEYPGLTVRNDPANHAEVYLNLCRFLSGVGDLRNLLSSGPDVLKKEKKKLRQLLSKVKENQEILCRMGSDRLDEQQLKEIREYIFCNHNLNVIAAADQYLKDGVLPAEWEPSAVPGPKVPQVFHDLAWLEHRRWVAFMRSEGFRCPAIEEEQAYIGRLEDAKKEDKRNKGLHKNIALRLHPCIVECTRRGMKQNLFESDEKDDDLLDAVSRRFWTDEAYAAKNLGTYDFKMYDYPDHEY